MLQILDYIISIRVVCSFRNTYTNNKLHLCIHPSSLMSCRMCVCDLFLEHTWWYSGARNCKKKCSKALVKETSTCYYMVGTGLHSRYITICCQDLITIALSTCCQWFDGLNTLKEDGYVIPGTTFRSWIPRERCVYHVMLIDEFVGIVDAFFLLNTRASKKMNHDMTFFCPFRGSH
jgi:hypothetical protein